jgi:hypothetical protein
MEVHSFHVFVLGFEVHDIDVELSSEGATPIHLVASDDADDGVIMITGGLAEIQGININQKHNSSGAESEYFFTGILKRGQNITINIFKSVSRKVKICALFLKNSAVDIWNKMSCPGCKVAVRAIIHLAIHAGFALMGVPSVGVTPHAANLLAYGADLLNKARGEFLKMMGGTFELIDFLEKIPGSNVIFEIFQQFDFVKQKIDFLYAWPCVTLGCCAQEEAA